MRFTIPAAAMHRIDLTSHLHDLGVPRDAYAYNEGHGLHANHDDGGTVTARRDGNDGWIITATDAYGTPSPNYGIQSLAGYRTTRSAALAIALALATATERADEARPYVVTTPNGAPRRVSRDGAVEAMQHHGMRYSEVAAHLADLHVGHTLTAEDGTTFARA